jgi:hypothetical protein
MAIIPGVTGQKAELFDGAKIDAISEYTAGNGVQLQGRTNAVAIEAGKVGEEIIGYCTSTTNTTTIDTEIDVPGCLINLTPGIWDLEYSVTTGIYRPSGGTPMCGRIRVTDAANVVEPHTSKVVYKRNVPSEEDEMITDLSCKKRILLSSNKSFKLRLTCNSATGVGQAYAYQSDTSLIGGISGNESTTYIRAVRIA